MKCELCRQDTSALIYLKVYTSKGINVCVDCYEEINSHRNQPYSRVMERLAVAEAGYQINRKQAKLRS